MTFCKQLYPEEEINSAFIKKNDFLKSNIEYRRSLLLKFVEASAKEIINAKENSNFALYID